MTDYLQTLSLLNSGLNSISSNYNTCPVHGCCSNASSTNTTRATSNDNSFENVLLNLISIASMASMTSTNNLISNVPMGYTNVYNNNIFGNNISSPLMTLNLLNTIYNSSINQAQNITNPTLDSTSDNSKTAKAIEMAKAQLGKPYVWGATGPDKFDCSGLTQYIYKHAYGKDIPRVSYDQAKFGQAVEMKDLQPGDLVFFDTLNKGRVSHVGIYIGNNEFIHASNRRDGVKKSTLTGVFIDKYKGARRP